MTALLFCIAVSAVVPNWDDPTPRQREISDFAGREVRYFTLRPIPRAVPLADVRIRPTEAAAIRGLVRKLADVEWSDLGYWHSDHGAAFAPAGAGRLVRIFDSTDAFHRLAALGPKAIPFLLEAINDATPTRLVEYGQPFEFCGVGNIFSDYGVWANPANADEIGRIGNPGSTARWSRGVKSYRLRVGDVCYVLLGQIANRTYRPVLYGTNCVFVDSPVDNPRRVAYLRRLWSGTDARRLLLDWLLVDFHTRQGTDYYRCSFFQIGAARRLAFYFPREAGTILAARMRSLDLAPMGSRGHPDSEGPSREAIEWNETFYPVELVEACAAADHPGVRFTALAVFRAARCPWFASAATIALGREHDEFVYTRLMHILEEAPSARWIEYMSPGEPVAAALIRRGIDPEWVYLHVSDIRERAWEQEHRKRAGGCLHPISRKPAGVQR
jgi:hypothetical protein